MSAVLTKQRKLGHRGMNIGKTGIRLPEAKEVPEAKERGLKRYFPSGRSMALPTL